MRLEQGKGRCDSFVSWQGRAHEVHSRKWEACTVDVVLDHISVEVTFLGSHCQRCVPFMIWVEVTRLMCSVACTRGRVHTQRVAATGHTS